MMKMEILLSNRWNEGVAVLDTTRLNNNYQEIKIDGYDKPILIDPNSD